jgi:hypothetical protein
MAAPGDGRVCAINLLPLKAGARVADFERFSADLDQPTCLAQDVVEGLVAIQGPPRTPGGAGHTSRGVVLSRPNGAAIRPPCVLPPLGAALASRTRGSADRH